MSLTPWRASGLALLVLAGAAGPALACDPQAQFIASLCMAGWPGSRSFNNGMFVPAQGQTIATGTNAAVFSLIGTTFGSNGANTFNLPDMRGRMVLGSDEYSPHPQYLIGSSVVRDSVSLSVANMPAHIHSLQGVSASVYLGSLPVNYSLASLTALALTAAPAGSLPLSGVSLNANTLALTVRSTSSGSLVGNPANALPAQPVSVAIYSGNAPSVGMAPGSVSGSIALSTTNPPATLSGTLNATAGTPTFGPVQISGNPTFTFSGSTNLSSAPTAGIPVIPPVLPIQFYFAMKGLYPSNNN